MRRTPPRLADRPTVALGVVLLFACSALVGSVSGVGAAATPEEITPAAVAGPTDGDRSDTRRATGEALNVTVTPARVAADVGDPVEVSGGADADTVRLYLVGPRGTFLDADGDAESMESVAVSAGTFDETYTAFSRRGSYTLLVVSPRADGVFESTETLDRNALPSGMTRDQAVDTVRHAYGGDEVVELTLRGETPSLGIDPVDEDGSVTREADVTVSGTANRGDGTSLTVDLLDGDGRVVAGEVATVDASAGRWSTVLDTSTLESGTYTLFVDDGVSTASTLVVVVDEERTAEETPVETPVPDEDGDDVASNASGTADNVTGTVVENATAGPDNATSVVGESTTNATRTENATASTNATANSTSQGTGESTSEGIPGFGVGVAVVAVVVAALAGRWRTDE